MVRHLTTKSDSSFEVGCNFEGSPRRREEEIKIITDGLITFNHLYCERDKFRTASFNYGQTNCATAANKYTEDTWWTGVVDVIMCSLCVFLSTACELYIFTLVTHAIYLLSFKLFIPLNRPFCCVHSIFDITKHAGLLLESESLSSAMAFSVQTSQLCHQ